ncbi:VOC family protein [Novosphingobium sp. G106]|uniref:VOC family protein n=1 Tax=Novosphingobium sp. G106 TaxID=2849500 RepID=UPI001C2D9D3F|nr:VOC family protein [Novosphingobium sp. G106]MBV1686830.1 VOC family protein [Novosphingobium sp. G106]
MLEGHLYQLGYACDNLEEGIAQFRGRGMTHEPHIIEVEQPVNANGREYINHIRLCFIWIGEMQYELIQAIKDPLGIYANAPSNGGPIRFHQTCMRVKDWADFRARVDQQDLPVAMERDMGGDNLKFLYLDGRAKFGHYLEYTWMTDAAWEQTRKM